MGMALNRPVDGLTVPDLLERLGIKSTIELPPHLVLVGGPVERERGFVLHTDDFRAPNSTVPVAEGLALTATRDVLEAMGDAGVRPRRSMLALGYAGWGAGPAGARDPRERLAHLRGRRGAGVRRRLREQVGARPGQARRRPATPARGGRPGAAALVSRSRSGRAT